MKLTGLALLATLTLIGCSSEQVAERPSVASPTPAAAGEPWTAGELQPLVRENVEEWLTTNSPAGTTASLAGAVCEPMNDTTFKCGMEGSLDEESGSSQLGHMTVVVTTTGDEFEWEMTQGWTPGLG